MIGLVKGLLLLMTLSLASLSHAFQTVNVRAGEDSGLIGMQLEYFADTDGDVTIETLLAPGSTSPTWVQSTLATPGFGFKPYPYWLRFRLSNATQHDHLWMTAGYPLLNHVDVHLVRDGLVTHVVKGGTRAGSGDSSHLGHQIMFRLPIAAGEKRDVYIRVFSESSLIIPLSISDPGSRLHKDDTRLRILGIFMGSLIALLLYHLVILVAFYETSFLLYIPIVLFSATSTSLLNGILDRYLLPGSDIRGHTLVPLIVAGVAAFGLFLTRAFLQTSALSKRLDQITLASATIASTIALLSLVIPYRYGIILTAMLVPISVVIALVASLASWRSGFKPSVYFAAGWFMIVFGAATYALRAFGILPENALTENFLYVALAMMMILIALALTARFSLMRARNESAQRSLREQILTTNRKLEREVETRTRELEENHRKLDEARRAVISREGQVATGVMSAGLAHEINNPNNFIAVGCQVLDQRLKNFELLINSMLDDNAPAEISTRLRNFFSAQQQSLTVLKQRSATLSEVVTRFRSVSTNDETDITVIDLMTRFERMIGLAKPGLPDSLQVDVMIKDYPMMRCRAGHIIQILLAILQLHADASRLKSYQLAIIAHREDNSMVIDFTTDVAMELTSHQLEWLAQLLTRHAATLSRPTAQRLSLRFPMEIADSQ